MYFGGFREFDMKKHWKSIYAYVCARH